MTRRQNNYNGVTAGVSIFPQKNPSEKSAEKFLASNFWYQDGIILIDYLPKGQTINANYYTSLLVQLKDILKEERRGKFTNFVSSLHDNASAHRTITTQKKLAYLGFHFLDHPPYTPDLALSDYHLFSGLKKLSNFLLFSSDAKVIAAALTWMDGQNSYFFVCDLKKLEQRSKECIELRGYYVE
jgi:histone-lysine N-methyltransferase SETMAR